MRQHECACSVSHRPLLADGGGLLSAANDRHLALRALEQALRRRCPEAGLLHHTDQSSPFASEDYQRVLAAHGITCSMSRRGNARDNAAMESWFSTMTVVLRAVPS